MKYLNLGCGHRFHPSWTNINFISTDQSVIAHDLKKGIPFPEQSFDIVYHSHMLEHLSKADAKIFMEECYRVLRPQGILRVVVPDLEQIARMYLHCLENACIGSEEWEQNYQWILLEMYDQTVRRKFGGEMVDFLSQQDIANREFVIKRCGVEIEKIINNSQKQSFLKTTPENNFKKFLKHIYRLLRYSNYRRQAVLKLILSPTELDALEIGQFRQSGEVHQWMYDHYSLSSLLKKCGLQEITKRTAHESYIPEWTSFNLDTEPDGSVYKPDSLYMESIKPVL
ncbi:methyltransferase domain-containing protein [Pseudanabaena sp. BC1403]|uniref:class I SAM-dependent methyltransferase n=1 Tax=Pseudanabaena sp. BC1403 TaxID=2043171 RepID=UPI000CD95FC1|nr:methyltransferase domain-containing protein [Pseudanabaena sp. BC1403]